MKVLVITVAGSSTRFSKSIGKDCLKCIYTESSAEDTLLYRLVSMNDAYDRFVIVGGFRYDELLKFIDSSLVQYKDRISAVRNEKYAEYGSGYSLLLGLEEAM